MPREVHSAEEIRDEIARLLNRERKEPLEVPLPVLVIEPDPFEGYGANWQMPRLPKTKGNEAAIGRAIINVKMRWNLKA